MNPLAPYEWIMATRFLREGVMQTLFIIAGVSLGVSVIVFMSALLTGLQGSLFSTLLDYQAQIVILPPEEEARPLREESDAQLATLVQPRAQKPRSLDQWQTVRTELLRLPGVLVVTPVVTGAGFVLRADANQGVSMTGIEPESYLRLIALKAKIVAGSAELSSSDIVIGTKLAKDLGVWLGDKLTLQTASGASALLTVSGIFDFGSEGRNEGGVYVALRTAQSLLGLPGGATSLQLKLAEPYAAETLAKAIEAQVGTKAKSWIETNAEFFSALSGQRLTFFVIRLFVGLTAALGIASVLVVSVVQKSKEIGILRATGTTRQQILRLFLLQGALLGLMGSVLGSFVGWLFLVAWRSYALNADGEPLFVINAEPILFVYVAAGATLVGTLAALFPAQRAARLDPAVAIRG
jgi:lipoprotein-releasing system permease protein